MRELPTQPLACFLCRAPLRPTSLEHVRLHPPATACSVKLTDICGISVDDVYELLGNQIYEREEPPPADPDVLVAFEKYTPTEEATQALFDRYQVSRLGGASGDKGWSSFSTWQRCAYLWKRTYLEHQEVSDLDLLTGGEPFGLAVGGLTHTLLAIHYLRKIDPAYPITPEIARDFLDENKVNGEALVESWRLFTAHRLFYKHEQIRPLAVEHHVRDPETGHSARYDLVLEVLDGYEGHLPGVYYMDHKTALKFDRPTLEGWSNDGTVIQQWMLWKKLNLDEQFGPIRGAIINLIGKQKVAELHRTFVTPNDFQIAEHEQDLRVHEAQRHLAVVTGCFPRSREGCISRYGMCGSWDHCITGER